MGKGRGVTTDGGTGGGAEDLPREVGTLLSGGIEIGGSDAGWVDAGGNVSGKLLGGWGSLSTEDGSPTGRGAGGAAVVIGAAGAWGDAARDSAADVARASRGRRGMPELPDSSCHSR